MSNIERDVNGKPPWERRRIRNEHSKPLVIELEKWLRQACILTLTLRPMPA